MTLTEWQKNTSNNEHQEDCKNSMIVEKELEHKSSCIGRTANHKHNLCYVCGREGGWVGGWCPVGLTGASQGFLDQSPGQVLISPSTTWKRPLSVA